MRYPRLVVLLVFVAPAVWVSLASAQVFQFRAEVVGVTDGDTIRVFHQGREEKIRLNGIDCPEKRQPFGNEAKRFTSELVFGKTVQVRVVDTDRYGRWVGDVTLEDGQSLNQALVAAGLAWWYRKHSNDEQLAQLEEEARTEGRGVWAEANPVPPWEWRRSTRGTR